MARYPEWFARLEAIDSVLRDAGPPWLGRQEIRAIFGCSERDAIRLLHRFGAGIRNDALSLPRETLLEEVRKIRSGEAFAGFQRQRRQVAKELKTAREEAVARQFSVPAPATGDRAPKLEELPAAITWRRGPGVGEGVFSVRYRDGGDLMLQLADFLRAAAADREEFFAGTEPDVTEGQ